jgi:hypothetical protein
MAAPIVANSTSPEPVMTMDDDAMPRSVKAIAMAEKTT